MKLTYRDMEILKDIQDFGLIPTRKIAERHFKNTALTTVLRRLRTLENARYIRRIDGLARGGHAWCLTKAAAMHLANGPAKFKFPRFILDHDITLAALRMRLEEAEIAKSWIAEHVIRSKMMEKLTKRGMSESIVPDGIMGIEDKLGYSRAIAIELELTTKNQLRYRNIQREYARMSDLHAYWYIVKSPAIARSLLKAATDGFVFGKFDPCLYISVLDDVMKDPREATVNFHGELFKAGDLFLPNGEAIKAAQKHAQTMSTQEFSA